MKARHASAPSRENQHSNRYNELNSMHQASKMGKRVSSTNRKKPQRVKKRPDHGSSWNSHTKGKQSHLEFTKRLFNVTLARSRIKVNKYLISTIDSGDGSILVGKWWLECRSGRRLDWGPQRVNYPGGIQGIKYLLNAAGWLKHPRFVVFPEKLHRYG